ncbi:hypothetical protein SAMN05428949_7193 [Chitinophaga sp. YR627]|uniref:hypothetical protein n=1 Tax=Chitinophaga sp. YR627 TaxID=1881041 RepID=UPI0008DEFAA5|nr:hypothetical protein [Chitinophaga sp. YR627]SFP01872.1 hypothetical protein SAMN05428949_7193 [Chitinophaga sp. YR627]
MKQYLPDKYGFKDYLLDNLTDARQEELIFWKKNIPMPVDLIYGIYEKRGILLAKYLDHVGTAFLYTYVQRAKGDRDWKSAPKNAPEETFKDKRAELNSDFKQYYKQSQVEDMLATLADVFMLEGYSCTAERMVEAMMHQGKKYQRLYIPKAADERIHVFFPELCAILKQNQKDMFSNVVADELQIYRMGFADAFAGIFNKLIDFVLDFYQKGIFNTSHTTISIIQDPSAPDTLRPEYGVIHDGCIWEPAYVQSAVGVKLNENHPFVAAVLKGGNQSEALVSSMLQVMSEIEYKTPRDTEKKLLEKFRQEVSRELRIKMESIL